MENFEIWYNKNYKKLLILPTVILLLAILSIGIFYIQTGDFINKDVSLTGGTTYSLITDKTSGELEGFLGDHFSDFNINTISDNSGNQIELVITVTEDDSVAVGEALEEFLGGPLTEENSSKESTSSGLSQDFYKQLIIAIILAFFWMSAVVFIIFSKGKKNKAKVVFLNILFGFFMGNFFLSLNVFLSGIIFIAFCFFLIKIYIKNSVPAFAVMLSAFANIVMTLAIVDLVGIKISIAGITAFLMLIGYSVDTDILLTTRLLKKRGRVNELLFGAFKTGTTMTITSIIAVTTALIVVSSFASVLNQIFTILLIGLGFDLFNTWITNASIMKWYVEEGR
jgi:preprotein translocase subunit SecF